MKSATTCSIFVINTAACLGLLLTSSGVDAFSTANAPQRHVFSMNAVPTALNAVAFREEVREFGLAVNTTLTTTTSMTVHEPDRELATRLLCASVMAQNITSEGGKLDFVAEKYVNGAAFLNEPTVIQGGIDNNDACLVGTTSDGVVVAFRGTVTREETKYSDWLSDLNIYPKQVRGTPGRVHTGFYTAVANLWSKNKLITTSPVLWAWSRGKSLFSKEKFNPPVNGIYIADEVRRQLKASASKKLYVTGHSKGAGMSSPAAWLFHADKTLPTPEAVIAFASPNPGNDVFAAQYGKVVTQYSYEAYDDLVTLLPGALYQKIADEGVFPIVRDILQKVTSRALIDDAIEAHRLKKNSLQTNSAARSRFAPIGVMHSKALRAIHAIEDARAGDLDYVPVGERIVIEKSGELTTAEEASDDDRLNYIFSQLFTTGGNFSDAVQDAVEFLGAAHCKECTGDDPDRECYGTYMTGVRGTASVCSGDTCMISN